MRVCIQFNKSGYSGKSIELINGKFEFIIHYFELTNKSRVPINE